MTRFKLNQKLKHKLELKIKYETPCKKKYLYDSVAFGVSKFSLLLDKEENSPEQSSPCKELSLCKYSDFQIPISLQPSVVDLKYYKL